MTRKIVWDNKAKQSFLQKIKYLKSRSPQSAQKVEDTILKRIETTVNNPEYFRPDKYKRENISGNFRAFEIFSIRISYFFDDNFFLITRVRHTKRKPLKY
jgi:plasmid stabilization system protein ParE